MIKMFFCSSYYLLIHFIYSLHLIFFIMIFSSFTFRFIISIYFYIFLFLLCLPFVWRVMAEEKLKYFRILLFSIKKIKQRQNKDTLTHPHAILTANLHSAGLQSTPRPRCQKLPSPQRREGSWVISRALHRSRIRSRFVVVPGLGILLSIESAL